MSIQAYSWALEQEFVQDHTTQLVLMCLAYYAGVDGLNAFPSVETLAKRARLSGRAVQKALRKLMQLGLLEEGNQAVAASYCKRTDRRPRNYNLILKRGEQDSPREVTGCTGERHGVNATTSRGEQGSPDPTLRSVREPKKVSTAEVEKEIALRFGRSVTGLAQQKRGPRH